MSKKRRKWSATEKVAVLQDAEVLGMAEASRKHQVSSTMIYRWRSDYEKDGVGGLERKPKQDPEKKQLEREIERLRQVVADQALTIRIKDELLKKTPYR